MSTRTFAWPALVVLAVLASLLVHAQSPARPAASAETRRAYEPPRTPWGDPDLQGDFSNIGESLIPMERPEALTGKRLEDVSEAELARLVDERNAARDEADRQRWELRSPLHWFENIKPNNSRAWLVIDPPDGRIPPLTAEARARAAARTEARKGRGEADSWEDRSLYDRCITRGLPGSMMPAIYGNAYRIVQGPGMVTITYEMVNETRVVPLDGRPHLTGSMRAYMGDGRGRFEGTTLVIETTNFTDRTPYRGSSERLRLVERFTPVDDGHVEWAVTFDDPGTWARPWTFAMRLTKVGAEEAPFEYACHEGNYAMRNLLSIARAEEAAASRKP